MNFQIACGGENQEMVSSALIQTLGIPPAALYTKVEHITTLAVAASQAAGRDFVLLPFCHTVEAKAMGAAICPADATAGPRPGGYTQKSVAALPLVALAAEPDAARLLTGCAALVQQGEQVVYQLSGPISILSCLLDLALLFKSWRKTPQAVTQCLDSIQTMLLDYARALCDTGMQWLAYADPAGSPDILGPKYGALLTAEFTVPFLRRLAAVCGTACTLVICPLTAAALERGGYLTAVSPGAGQLAVACIKRTGCTMTKKFIISAAF